MAITMDVSGKSLMLRVLKGIDFEELRDKVKTLGGKKPIYEMIDGQHKFSYWEVPNTELGSLLERVGPTKIIAQSDKAKELLSRFALDTCDLLSLPPILDEITWIRKPRNEDQEEYIRINSNKNRIIAALEPGLGKTFVSLMRAQVLGAKKILVVVPSVTNITTWEAEAQLTLGKEIVTYHGSPAKRKKLRETINNNELIITTYTVLHELAGVYEYDHIIADEAHNASRPTTQAFKSMKKLCSRMWEAGLQLLSGTPVLHKPKDLWGLVYLINPMIAGEQYAWERRYEKVEDTIKKKIPMKRGGEYVLDDNGRVQYRIIEIPIKTSPQNLDELTNRIKAFTYRKTRKGLVNFEDKVDIAFVKMTKRQEELYRQAKSELFLDLQSGQLKLSTSKIGRITRFLQICEGAFNLDENEEASSKFDYICDQLDQAEGKVIVWSRFKPISYKLYERYKDRSVIFNGDLTKQQKDLAKWNFQGCEIPEHYAQWKALNKGKFKEPGQAQFLFGVIDRGQSAGSNFHACDRQFVTSFSWNGAFNEQTLSRIKRLSQESDLVHTTIVLCHNQFEQQAFNLVLSNYKTTVGILDGEEDLGYVQIQSLIDRL